MVNFHAEAITPGCQTALTYLQQQLWLEGFYLAGGTALALQIGHRNLCRVCYGKTCSGQM